MRFEFSFIHFVLNNIRVEMQSLKMLNLFCTFFSLIVTTIAFQIQVYVPVLVELGRPATLACFTSLDKEHIHKVNWSKDGYKFYRYKSSDHYEPKKIFQVPGTSLDLSSSNLTHILLNSVNISSEGIYTCEVETTGPAFRSNSNSSELKIFSIPQENLKIEKTVNDRIVNLTCISTPTYPETKLAWLINEQKPKKDILIYYPTQTLEDGTKVSRLGLSMKSRALRGATTFKCKGDILFQLQGKTESIGELSSSLTVHVANPSDFTHETMDYVDNSFESYNRDKFSSMEEDGNTNRRQKSYNSSSCLSCNFLVTLFILIRLIAIKF